MKVKTNPQSAYPLDYHFRGKRINMKPLFEDLIGKLNEKLILNTKSVKLILD